MMRFSTSGVKKLQDLEGFSLKPYKDAGGLLTIGFGHLIKPNEKHLLNPITEAQAHDLFVSDIVPFINRVNKYVKAPLTQDQFDALVIWDYNTGRIHNSDLTKLINSGADPEKIQRFWISNYLTSGGKYIAGLLKRRKEELSLFTGKTDFPAAGTYHSNTKILLLVATAALLFYSYSSKRSRSV